LGAAGAGPPRPAPCPVRLLSRARAPRLASPPLVPYPLQPAPQPHPTPPPNLQFATEAAITILRIDDLIRLEPQQAEGDDE
jgi:hypothetical protein